MKELKGRVIMYHSLEKMTIKEFMKLMVKLFEKAEDLNEDKKYNWVLTRLKK